MPFTLDCSRYLLPTPAGAFHAASASPDAPGDRLRSFITALMQGPETPRISREGICRWSGIDNEDAALEFFWRMQELGWVQALDAPRAVSTNKIEDILGELLPHLTHGGKALLADAHGFYLSSYRFSHEVAEELSALSADLASLHKRRSGSLNTNLGLSGGAWGLLDAAGQSQIGFWPIHAANARFVLIVSGMPTFNQPEMVDLVWVLQRRYTEFNTPLVLPTKELSNAC
jgi:hypothetical protein